MALRRTIRAVHHRGYPIWVGGRARHVGLVAAEGAAGWNRWGCGVETFRRELGEVQRLVDRLGEAPSRFTPSWGGLVLLGATDAQAEAKRERFSAGPNVLVGGPERVADAFRSYVDAGAQWITVGPVDSSDPENAAILGELVLPLLT
jgi:alkanesulfonate monooxygenase SsuD/methylene tetrahydromethanopterin reductase-like flavin-dependent oxidoreductase (luciferase family)